MASFVRKCRGLLKLPAFGLGASSYSQGLASGKSGIEAPIAPILQERSASSSGRNLEFWLPCRSYERQREEVVSNRGSEGCTLASVTQSRACVDDFSSQKHLQIFRAGRHQFRRSETLTTQECFRRSYSLASNMYANPILDDPGIERRPGIGEQDVNITTTSAYFVQPAIRLESTWLALSNMDKLMPSVYQRSFFVYKSTKGRSFQNIVASLKETLSHILVPFYPLAGRMKTPNSAWVHELHCNGNGAEFIEAYADRELDDLDYHQPNPVLGTKLAASNFIQTDDSALSPLCIQITRFRCGGVTVGCSFHHQVADVHAGHLFLKAWSQAMKGQSMTSFPIHDRSLLDARQPPRPSMDHEVEYMLKPKEEPRMPRPGPATQELPIVSRTFHFPSSVLRNLKKTANGQRTQTPAFTSTEVTSSYLWRLVTKARGIPEDQRVKLFLGVDGRSRVKDPALPDGYFGNMVALASSNCSTGQLLQEPLGFAAELVQRSKARTATDGYFRSLIDWVELNKPLSVIPNLNIFKDPVMIVSSCIHLPMYEIDFGWGRPLFAGFSAIPEGVGNFMILLPSPLGYGNLSASLYLRADHMEKLENDSEFQMVADANV